MQRACNSIVRDVLTLAFVALTAMPGCSLLRSISAGFKKPTVHFKEMHVRKMSFSHAKLDFEFEVRNPNSVGLQIAEVDYQLDIDGNRFVAGKTAQGVSIAPNGASLLKVPVAVEFAQLGRALYALFSERDKVPYRLQIGFSIDTPIGVITVPLDIKGDIPLPRLPDIALASVNMGRLDLLGATLQIELDVTNRAGFSLADAGVRYQINAAGTTISDGSAKVPAIEPGLTAKVTVPVSVNFLGLGTAVVRVIKSRMLPYRITGTLDMGPLHQPFSWEGLTEL